MPHTLNPAAFLLLIFFNAPLHLQAQQCLNDSTGLIPINDLGAGSFNGLSGGLYGNGANQPPAAHLQNGLMAAQQIIPRNTQGQPDSSGRIGFLAIGMSNCNQFFSRFMDSANAWPGLNPEVTLVNGGVGGKDIDLMLDTNDSFWTTVDQRLGAAGLSDQQVQVIWFLQAKHISGIPAGQGVEHIDSMERKFLMAFRYLKQRYPRLRSIYCSGRDYGGYSNPGSGNPEPYAYYTGWAFRKLVERQMNGDTTASLLKTGWLGWADYIWADGKNLRSDGLQYLCPEDFQNDGVHPSDSGRNQIARLLMKFFRTDTTTQWFRMQSAPTALYETTASEALSLYPNPAGEQMHLSASAVWSVYNLQGQGLLHGEGTRLDVSGLVPGLHVLRAQTAEGLVVKKFLRQ
jgi:lysophospholipase L1-like esterase